MNRTRLLLSLAALSLFSLAERSFAQSLAPVSGGDRLSASAAGGSFLPVFSQDAYTIVYLSHANNLVTNDDSRLALDVFGYNLRTDQNELISLNTSRRGGGDAAATHASVSRYGYYVVFASRASNLTTNDTNNAVDIFFRSVSPVAAPFTRLMSGDTANGSPVEWQPSAPRPLSTSPQISALNGVVFASAATNLIPGLADTNGTYDVFVRDPFGVSGATRLVSVANVPGITPDSSSHSPQISDNGQYVAFISTATNLLLPPGTINTNRGGDVYIRDLDNGQIHWASTNTQSLLIGVFPAPPTTYTCFNYALSGFGRHVVYQASPPVYAPDSSNVLVYSEIGSTPIRIATDSDLIGRPQISATGEWVAFSSSSNIYLWNRTTGSNTLISVSTNGGPANGPSHSPVMSTDVNARLIAFVSKATDLVANAPSNRFQIYLYDRLIPTMYLVSINTNGTASEGDFELSNVAVPSEGPLRVAFDSTAPDLVANDFNGVSDVFLRDLMSNQTRLISRAHTSLPARTTALMSGTSAQSISADGGVVVFTAFDSPFIPDDTNIWQDVLVRDLTSGTLSRLASSQVGSPQISTEPVVSAAGHHAAYTLQRGFSTYQKDILWHDLTTGSNLLVTAVPPGVAPVIAQTPLLSSDGMSVVFQSTTSVSSYKPGLGDGNSGGNDIFLRDMATGEFKLISINYAGTASANRPSSNAVFSANARWVAFESSATDLLATNITGGIRSLFVRDLLSNVTEVASVGSNGSSQWGSRGRAAFSGNSRFVALVGDNYPILRRDLELKISVAVSQGENPSLNWDGRFVAYQTLGFQGTRQIYVSDFQNGTAKLISASLAGMPANRDSTEPQITPDGRFIVFQSLASDLVQNDNNNALDIFVGDRVLGTVVLLTINSSGTGSANGPSSKASLSADGHTVLFQSIANDLVTGDYNNRRDVFVATLSLPDADGDGMDDDFEITYFGDLSHNGTADSDGDGQTDYQEFLAGTNPTSDTSILRAITVTGANTPGKQVIWSAVPGRSYIVQYKDALNAAWSTLAGTVRATASTAAKRDVTSSPRRFYRVLLAE